MKSFNCSLAVFALFVFAPLATAQSTPIVAGLPRADVPSQRGLGVRLADKGSANRNRKTSEKYPILVYRGLAFIAYSHNDNRTAMTIIGYDNNEIARVRFEKQGARYLKKIRVDARRKTAHFIGQNDREIVVPWKQLSPATQTKSVGITRKNRTTTRGSDTRTPRKGGKGPKDFEQAMRDLEKMQRDWESMEKEMTSASKEAAAAVRKERAEILQELKTSKIGYEDAVRLSAMAVLLDATVMAQMLGDVFTGDGMTEKQVEQEIAKNTKILRLIQTKVASKAFTGTKSEQKKLQGQIDKMLTERAKAKAKPSSKSCN